MVGGQGPGAGWVVNSISGSVVIGTAIQGRDITVQLPPQVPSGLNGWRPPTPEFVGRSEALAGLLDVLAPDTAEAGHSADADTGARAGLVAAVTGLGGIGKTELAVQAAHVALRRGWFPGGVLAIDLHGYDSEPTRLQAERAVANLLRGLGVSDQVIPAALDERVRMYRAILASYSGMGRPVLVVLDNASPRSGVDDLLPGVGRAVITSRHVLGRLHARFLGLEVLTDRDAVDLLDRLLVSRRPADTRVTDDPGTAAEVANTCAGLPLALQLVASLLAAHLRMPLDEMAARLRDETTRLANIDDERPGVQAAINLSYAALPADQRRMFRLMTCNTGPQISTTAAAVAACLGESEGRHLIERLAEAHLIEPGDPYGWWRMHDLIRLYATELGLRHTATDHRDQAIERLLGYYLDTTRAATAHLSISTTDPAAAGFSDRDQALAWLDAEAPNLAAATRAAACRSKFAISLPLAAADYFRRTARFDDWTALTELAVVTARRLGDRHGECLALTSLGDALRHGPGAWSEEAIDACTDAITICRELGDRHSEGIALINLGNALCRVRRFGEAVDACADAAAVFEETGDRTDEAVALINLACALQGEQRFDEAVAVCTTAGAISSELGNRELGQGALSVLMDVRRKIRRLDYSVIMHTDNAAFCRELGDRHSEGIALINLGNALCRVRRFGEAVDACATAASIFRVLGDDHSRTIALGCLEEARGAWQATDRSG